MSQAADFVPQRAGRLLASCACAHSMGTGVASQAGDHEGVAWLEGLEGQLHRFLLQWLRWLGDMRCFRLGFIVFSWLGEVGPEMPTARVAVQPGP